VQLIDGIPVFGEPIANAVAQIRRVRDCGAARVALMADHHLGYSQPIGGVAAYRNQVSPSGVGYDIACGNKAVLTDVPGSWLREHIESVMDRLYAVLEFGIGRTNPERPEAACLEDHPAWDIEFVSGLRDLAASQLGTIGSGNHYVDLFTDEADRVWIGVHFGSRGLGHRIATEYIARAGGKDGVDAAPAVLEVSSSDGREYLAAMALAGEYAYAGRSWVCERVARILGAETLEEIHNHHNFAWREEHGGEKLWVVRKGATPAFPGQPAFVGATRSEPSVILEGAEECALSQAAMSSTVHGAGRVMSRTQAAGKFRWRRSQRDGRLFRDRVKAGEITAAETALELAESGVVLRGSANDEAPRAYKRLGEVLKAHGDTIRILHTLTPVGVAMAGADQFDPYRD
jgi:tRNA-splicing ligase RtcB